MTSFLKETPKAQISCTSGSIAAGGAFVTFTTVDLDNDFMTSNFASQPDRLIVKTAGRYIVAGMIDYQDVVPGGQYRIAEIWKNGTRYTGQANPAIANGAALTVTAWRPLYFNVNDYIQLKFVQNHGSALTLGNAYQGSFLFAQWINSN